MADYAVSRSAAIIEAAISVFEEVLRLRHIGHQQRAEATGDLGNALFTFCLAHEASQTRRAFCFDLLREVLQLCPPGHSSRDEALHNLARALLILGHEQPPESLDNLRESILLSRAALQLRPAGHAERAETLNLLACGLERRFQHCGDLNVLAEAITMHREVLLLRPLSHSRRDMTLLNLTAALASSFQHQGGSETLAEAVSLGREALNLHPVGHPRRWGSISTLGDVLGISFESTGFPETLSECIDLQRESVRLAPSGHPQRGAVLGNLARGLMLSYGYSRDRKVLTEAIVLLRELSRQPVGGLGRADGQIALAEALVADFDEHKNIDHLHESVSLLREALKSRPPGHFRRSDLLQKLGHILCRSECRSWTEALALYREALDICPVGSPLRSEILSNIAECFLDPESPFFDISEGVAHLSAAYSDHFSHVNRRLRSALSDLIKVESAYAQVAAVLDPVILEHCNNLVLDLYTQVIGLLPRAANFGLGNSTRLLAVTGLDGIARDAAARAILLGHTRQALEMLEEGRGVFWTQSLHLRTSAFEEVPQEERQKLQGLLRLLEYSARRVEGSDQTAAQRERDLEKRRQLNEEAESLILSIRGYTGLDRFLMPPAFDALIDALPEGFVVVVNTSKLGDHALLLHRATGLATCLKLQPPLTGFNSVTVRSNLPRHTNPGVNEDDTRAMRKDIGRGGSFLDILSELWASIVQPVVTQLGLPVRCESHIHTHCH
jgi:hypothetical protein